MFSMFSCSDTNEDLLQPPTRVPRHRKRCSGVFPLLALTLLAHAVNMLSLIRGYGGKGGGQRSVNRTHENTFNVSETMAFVLTSAG